MQNQSLEKTTDKEISEIKNEKGMVGSNMISLFSYENNLNILKKCLCRIVVGNKIFGTGFLLKLEKKEKFFYFLISCEHVISEIFINKKKKIIIKYNYTDGNHKEIKIKLDKNERFIRPYKYLDIDATVVQIFPEKNEIEKEFFYEINKNYSLIDYEIFKKDNIRILQFPGEGNTLYISQGKYENLYNITAFFHSATTEGGSSGSPIFIFDKETIIIFGIHKGCEKDNNKNIGAFIFPILDSLKRDSYYEKTEVFEGEIIENYVKKGEKEKDFLFDCIQKGALHKEKDKIYIGDLYHYKPHGKGTLYEYNEKEKKKKMIYSGDFVDGKFNGKGFIYYDYNNKTYYKGDFLNNLRHGKGKYYENGKLVYEGEFSEDKYNGKGKMYYKDGRVYEGKFSNGKRDGEGIEFDSKGNIIEEGEFENGDSPNNLFIKKTSENTNLNQVNDIINSIFMVGQKALFKSGIKTNMVCRNCNCSTDDHFLIGNSIWECKKCFKKCKNNVLQNFFN